MSNGSDGMGVLKRAAERSPRRTGLRVVLFLVIAAGAAALAVLLVTRYVETRTAAARVSTTPVVVATIDLPEATTLRADVLSVVQWPSANVPEGAASDPAKLVDRVVRARVIKGEPVVESRLAAADAGHGLAAILPPGMRAAAVPVNDVVGVAGFIHPGDSVDVIVVMRPETNGNSNPAFFSKIILQNVQVLAVGKELGRNERSLEKSLPATVATLMVDSEQSEKLALAQTKGSILLTLRSGIDRELVDTTGVNPAGLVNAHVEPPVNAKPPPPVRRVARAPEAPKQVVEILRGDMYERRDFGKGGAK
ncbi:Flp pilus assembly protein CpaB [Anaeromyxobacter sp. K]|uniref:Flp pilus assembly protein CpaB n=1 Tax=Anaeromyxobacter sp. (strain K) TaxID=447217 RepID=UPI00015F8AD9|nr:Flp pilus assembly protein CpaB [Anaeromyxobacter sp. K]ACG74140.1 Flp pilus assembly protein CpaB [Anaeromyxobacter sp. K]